MDRVIIEKVIGIRWYILTDYRDMPTSSYDIYDMLLCEGWHVAKRIQPTIRYSSRIVTPLELLVVSHLTIDEVLIQAHEYLNIQTLGRH